MSRSGSVSEGCNLRWFRLRLVVPLGSGAEPRGSVNVVRSRDAWSETGLATGLAGQTPSTDVLGSAFVGSWSGLALVSAMSCGAGVLVAGTGLAGPQA